MFERGQMTLAVGDGDPSVDEAWFDDAHVAAVVAAFEAELAAELVGDPGEESCLDGPEGAVDPAADPLDDRSDVDRLAIEAATMAPGPELAALLSHLVVSPLSPAARVDVLVGAERLARWATALPMRILVEHVGPRDLPDRAPADWSAHEQRSRLADAAHALETSENELRGRLEVARLLCAPGAALASTGRALAAGEISPRHARVLLETTGCLDPAATREVEQRVLSKATGRPPARFRQICRRAVAAVDSQAAVRRHQAAVEQRSVRWWPEADGMARLQVYGPASDVMAIHAAVDLLAGSADAQERRPVAARRFDALLAVCLAVVAPDPARDAHVAGLRPLRHSRPEVQAQIVVDLATLLGLADNPAELRGYGTIPAGVAREWLEGAQTWRRLVTDPVTGHLLDYGRVVRLAPHRLRDFVLARDGTCGFPGCGRRADARGVEVDHHPPWQPDGSGGSTSAAQTGALCAHHHHLRTHGSWQLVERTHGVARWCSPSGREIDVAPDAVLGPA